MLLKAKARAAAERGASAEKTKLVERIFNRRKLKIKIMAMQAARFKHNGESRWKREEIVLKAKAEACP